MASPQGNKFREWIRAIALRVLTDKQRTVIKSGIERVRTAPLSLTGVTRTLNEQKREIERLKSKLTLLEGKFNLALYGLPHAEELRTKLISNSLLDTLETRKPLALSLSHPESLIDSAKLNAEVKNLGVISSAQRALVIGTSDPVGVQAALQTFGKPQSLHLSDTTVPASGLDAQHILATDPMTALLALPARSMSWIACLNRITHLSPLEQLHFWSIASDQLAPGGTLFVTIAKTESPGFWKDPRNLRPCSIELVREALQKLPGKSTLSETPSAHWVFFRKDA